MFSFEGKYISCCLCCLHRPHKHRNKQSKKKHLLFKMIVMLMFTINLIMQ